MHIPRDKPEPGQEDRDVLLHSSTYLIIIMTRVSCGPTWDGKEGSNGELRDLPHSCPDSLTDLRPHKLLMISIANSVVIRRFFTNVAEKEMLHLYSPER